MSRKNIILCLWLTLLAAGSVCLYPEPDSFTGSALENFRKMVILENGRKKPLDTCAQNMLKQFSGKSRYGHEPAIQWLARVLFFPEKASRDRIFLIGHSEVLNSLGVAVTGERDRYSFAQLEKSLGRLKDLAFSASRLEGQDRSIVENEIILLYNKVYVYQELRRAFRFAVPEPDLSISNPELKQWLKLPEDREIFSFLELMKNIRELNRAKQSFRKNENTGGFPPGNEVLKILDSMENWLRLNRESTFTVIYRPENGKENWLSPWQCLNESFQSQATAPDEVFRINEFVNDFIRGRQQEFDQSVRRFNDGVMNRLKGKLTAGRVSLEVFYNKADPFYRAQFFYGFSLFLLLISFLILKKWFYRLSFFLLLSGLFLHLLGLVCRILIMQRPPATNLYETFIFSGWITVVIGVILEWFKKKNIGILTGSITGIVMLLIAGKYALEGDTMGMLVAVLDSNFWLSTHVITITVGFAGIVISGIIGHVYVFQKIWIRENPKKKNILKNTFQSVYATQAFGLIFTFLGTVLGGMWADQSWGRFWGWDPKENGALIVVLWSALLFHSRLSNWMGENGFSLGAIVGIISVALSWFGINLLGVGLHSYGFTSGIALALSVFIVVEFIFVFSMAVYIRKKGLL
jgi:ABC-type transport system involved in cytochrome c biogenesis permease subunit